MAASWEGQQVMPDRPLLPGGQQEVGSSGGVQGCQVVHHSREAGDHVCVLTLSHVKSLKFKIVAQLELFLSFILMCCISQEKKPKYQIKTKSIVYPGSTGPPVADSFSGTLDRLLGM